MLFAPGRPVHANVGLSAFLERRQHGSGLDRLRFLAHGALLLDDVDARCAAIAFYPQPTGYSGEQSIGGRGGIRTHGTLAGTPVFKTGALNHSATLPSQRDQALNPELLRTQRELGPNPDPSVPPSTGQNPRRGVPAGDLIAAGFALAASIWIAMALEIG